jgi:hypothetical protein
MRYLRVLKRDIFIKASIIPKGIAKIIVTAYSLTVKTLPSRIKIVESSKYFI